MLLAVGGIDMSMILNDLANLKMNAAGTNSEAIMQFMAGDWLAKLKETPEQRCRDLLRDLGEIANTGKYLKRSQRPFSPSMSATSISMPGIGIKTGQAQHRHKENAVKPTEHVKQTKPQTTHWMKVLTSCWKMIKSFCVKIVWLLGAVASYFSIADRFLR